MAALQPQRINNLGVYGLVRPSSIDDDLIPEEAVTEAVNVHFDRVGVITVRPGLSALGSTVEAGVPCYGLYNAQAGTALSVFETAIFSFNGSSWGVSLDGGTASVRVRFVDFASYTIALNYNYNTYTSMRFWNAGSSRHWHHTGRPINPQNMWGRSPQYGEVFKSKVYLFGDTSQEGNSSRLYFSSVITSTGNITWSPTVDFVDINPGDGESGTGLKRYSLELLCFKPNYIYRFKTTGVDPDPLIRVGTRSNESVVEGKRGMYFHHDTGFYRYDGSYPQEISRAIIDLVEAIPYSQYDTIEAWNDDDHIYWSVGDITVADPKGDVTIKNAVLRYTESADIWTLYSYASDIRAGMIYTRDTTRSRLVGLDNGVVATQNSGTTDLEEPIQFRARTRWIEFGNIAEQKHVEELVAVCEKSLGTTLMYQTDENVEWHTFKKDGGQLKKMINHFDRLDLEFQRIRFLVTGSTRFESSVFREIQIVKGENQGLRL